MCESPSTNPFTAGYMVFWIRVDVYLSFLYIYGVGKRR